MFSNQKTAKNCFKFYCEICDYGTRKKSSYDDHLLTLKHQKSMIGNENQQKICQKYICPNCDKEYKDNSGLWRHRKKCIFDTGDKNLPSDKELMMMLIKDNTEMKKMMMKVLENGTNNHNHRHNTTNSHNKAFNLNLYLEQRVF